MGYAILGIPLTLLYLSSVGSLLSHVARGVFSRALCCCLCSNCGYCCYDEKRMAEKERRMKKKRQQIELQQQLALQEPFYVRSNSGFTTSTTGTTTHNNLHSPVRDLKETDSLSCTDNESKTSMHGLSILAPILLCLIDHNVCLHMRRCFCTVQTGKLVSARWILLLLHEFDNCWIRWHGTWCWATWRHLWGVARNYLVLFHVYHVWYGSDGNVLQRGPRWIDSQTQAPGARCEKG